MKTSLDMDNVEKLTYYSTSKKVASISKDGKITAKKKGTTMIKVRVTLKNGSSKVMYMKVTIK